MKNNKYIHLLYTILVTGAAFLVNYGISLVLVPFITTRVGEDAYGFVSLSKEFAQYAALVTAAINSFASRYIAVEYHKNHIDRANVFYSSVFYGNLMIGSVILAVAGVGIVFLERFLNIPEYMIADVKMMFLIVFLDFWLITVFTVFGAAAYIEDKLSIVNLFKGIGYITEAVILTLAFVFLPARIYYVGIGIIAVTIISSAANVWVTRKYTPSLRIRWKDFSLSAVKRLVFDGIWSSVSSLGKILNQGLDLVVCNLMLDPLVMSELAIAKTIDSIAHAMYLYLAQVFHPMFLKSYASEDRKRLMKDLRFSMKVCGLFSNLIFAGFVAIGLAFYRLWIPNQNIELIYKLTVIALATGVFVGPLSPLYYIYVLTVKRAFSSIVVCMGGLLNVLGMYLLIKYTDLGVYSIVITTTVIEAFIAYVTNPLYMAHVLKIRWYSFYPGLIRNMISSGALVLLFKGIAAVLKPDSWITLLISVALCLIPGCVAHLLIVCKKEEWIQILKICKRRFS